MFGIARWTELICYSSLAIASVIADVKMVRMEGRRADCFLLTLSILIALYGLLRFPYNYAITNDRDEAPGWTDTAYSCSDFSVSMVHWIFPTIIFRTAWNVPLIFKWEIDVERSRKIDRITAVFIFATTIYEFIFNLTGDLVDNKTYIVYSQFDAIFQGLYLVSSVLYLRRKINQVENLHADSRLILVHVFNFVFLSMLVFANEILFAKATNMEDDGTYKDNVKYEKKIFYINLTEALVVVMECYMLLFLLWLAYGFAKNSK